MNRLPFILYAVVIMAGLWLAAASAHAQLALPQQTGFNTLTINLFPEHPGPNQSVTATLTGFSVDLQSARIQWFRNGQRVADGAGLRTYTFSARGTGSEEALRAVATAPDGKTREASLSFRIGDIDLLWRAQTTAPPWYAGKRLASPRSRVIVSAIPHLVSGGREIPASQLIYEWTLDGKFNKALSGAGRQTFAFQAGEASTIVHEVAVEVSTPSNSITAAKTSFIDVESPKVLFYEERPLEGVRAARALSTARPFSMNRNDDKEFRAVPFFFSTFNNRESLNFSWSVDGQAAAAAPGGVLRLKSGGGTVGTVSVRAEIQNTVNILQQIQTSFYVAVQ
ncbi:MAG: hypothetical protein HYT22_00800 [Candidatus Niyogibacteria bacterium]|nr:hypothetical protein [Candidatus Niyogibacteria bacterium]